MKFFISCFISLLLLSNAFATPLEQMTAPTIFKTSATHPQTHFKFINNFTKDEIGGFLIQQGWLTDEDMGFQSTLVNYTRLEAGESSVFTDHYFKTNVTIPGELFVVDLKRHPGDQLVALCGFARGFYCDEKQDCIVWYGLYAQDHRCDFGQGDGSEAHPKEIILNIKTISTPPTPAKIAG